MDTRNKMNNEATEHPKEIKNKIRRFKQEEHDRKELKIKNEAK